MVNPLYDGRTANWLQFLSRIPPDSRDWIPGSNVAALRRQVETVQLIIQAHQKGRPGVIIADDVGLGKTWIGVLTAIAWASCGKKVMIVAPNRNLRDKWNDDLDTWYGGNPNPALWRRNDTKEGWEQMHPGGEVRWGLFGVNRDRLAANFILLMTSNDFKERQKWNTDLLIVDEAHRGKNEEGFIDQIPERTRDAFRLLLTATPFGKDISAL